MPCSPWVCASEPSAGRDPPAQPREEPPSSLGCREAAKGAVNSDWDSGHCPVETLTQRVSCLVQSAASQHCSERSRPPLEHSDGWLPLKCPPTKLIYSCQESPGCQLFLINFFILIFPRFIFEYCLLRYSSELFSGKPSWLIFGL